jgi:hypothetical protein
MMAVLIECFRLSFQVPFVPFIPCLSVVLNTYLMTQLDSSTWIRFTVWLFIGIMIYLCYGLNHSVERLNHRRKVDETYMKQIRYEIQVYWRASERGWGVCMCACAWKSKRVKWDVWMEWRLKYVVKLHFIAFIQKKKKKRI